MNSTTPQPPPSPWRILWLGTLVILIFEVIAIFVGAKIGSFATFFVLLFGGFFIGGAASKYINDWAGVAAGIGFLVGTVIAFGNVAQPLSLILTGQHSTLDYPIAVNRTPEYNVTLFEFIDGQVKTNVTGYHSYSGYSPAPRTGGRGYPFTAEYTVAPLVPKDWTPADEVPVWVVCHDSWDTNSDVSDTDTCRREWTKDLGMGSTIDASELRYVKAAVADAEGEHEIHSHPNAKYIYWSKDAVQAAQGAKGMGITLIIIGHLSYAIAVIAKRKKINP